jgi:hypothetical protein
MRITFEVPDKDSGSVCAAVDALKAANEVEKLNAVCFWLIKQCQATNAQTMTVDQTGVHHLGQQIGDWSISVRKRTRKEST